MKKRILAVDPGQKRIGLAISDPTGTIARPLKVIQHVSRDEDARKIIRLATEQDVELIVVGQALDSEGEIGPRARSAQRFAKTIRERSDFPVVMWDESGSTQMARQTQIDMGIGQKKRRRHFDDTAAAVILQDYLNTNKNHLDDHIVE